MSEREFGRSLYRLRLLSDEELARVTAEGDEDAARVLLERFEEPLYRYTVALVRDPELAREATWSALFEAARTVRTGEYSEPVKPWLFRVAHTAADVAGGRPDDGGEDVDGDEAAARAAAAPPEDRERLGNLLARLQAMPRRDRESLLLRELVGLEYVGIATVTGARPAAARQAVFRARLGLQDDPEATTEHCDEIRAAMSKAESDVRERRSIAVHLESCPVCEEFASQLETRPDDLLTLFPAPEEPLVAELVPPLPPVTPAQGAYAETAAGAAGAETWTEERDGRGGRRLLVPALIALVLIGAGVAAALALTDNGGGDKGKARAAREQTKTFTTGGGGQTKTFTTGGGGQTKTFTTGGGGAKGGTSSGGSASGSAKRGGSKRGGSKGGGSKSSAEKRSTKSGAAAGGSASGTSPSGGKATAGKAPESRPPEGKSSGSGSTSGGKSGEGAPSKAGGAAASGSAASGSNATAAGTVSDRSEREAERRRAATAPGTVPRTGLDVVLVIAMGFLMLALGISLRRVYAEI